ncbi:MAG: hypothetical protein L7T24_00075 [Luminiphilus sp.]|nr:hypothetical protein [Luminiphilus sp.]
MSNRIKPMLGSAAVAAACLLSGSLNAQVIEEDSSTAFKASNEALGAALGYPSAESTVTTHENGMTSARMGLESMKMLVVRQNPDGTLSYGHAGSAAGAEAFVNNPSAGNREER